ncbi:MAG TPA: DoxX family protein [Acidobacteriaceae bacterium]|nr:DoxX family protein [Acidobacteriaceae bacterium]
MSSSFERIRPSVALVGRVVLGAIMLAHGWGKVVPRGSLYNFAHVVARLGLPYWLGYVAAFTEFFGGIALILGLLTPLVALAVAIEMLVAILKIHLRHGLTGAQGYEFPLSLLALSLLLIADGPGYLAVDRVVFRGGR